MAPKILRATHALACLLLVSGIARVINAECTAAYQKIEGHTMCLEDSPKLQESHVLSSAEVTEIVDGHNQKRRTVTPPATNMQQVKWDAKIAEVAQKWAKQCRMKHDTGKRSVSDYPGVGIGQNLFWGSGRNSWTNIINSWHSEETDFTYGVGATPTGAVIGHYTQMVLHKVARIGCGHAQCSGGHYYVCNYASGQLSSDQVRPYESGERGSDCPNNNNGLCDCNGKLCLNGGNLDLQSCTCTCNKPYVGDTCAETDCPPTEPRYCKTDPKSKCEKFSNWPNLCPFTCGVCENEICDGKQCLNGGSLDFQSCTCTCKNGFTGDTCANCPSTEPRHCKSYPKSHCEMYSNWPSMCPFTCDVCENEQNCDGKLCLNGGSLDLQSCECTCKNGFTGDTCAICPSTENNWCKLQPKSNCRFSNWPDMCPYSCGICENEKLNCPPEDMPYCPQLNSQHCVRYGNIPNVCPYMCGICKTD